jgi:predicted Zn-dependent peptidase
MTVDRSSLPRPGPERPFSFPNIARRRLSNGIDAWTAEQHDVPLVSVIALVRAGAAYDPPERPGLAALTADLLDEGCGDLDALALHETIGRLGAQVDTEVGADAALLGLTTLARFATPAFRVLADMLAVPRLDDRDFERVRDLRLNRLLQLREMPPALAERTFTQRVYGAHPYGHLPIGSESSLEGMSVAETRAFHRTMYEPSRVTIIAVGDASHDELAALTEEAFGSWRGAGEGASLGDPAALPIVPEWSDRFVLIPRPGAPQSELRIGHMAAARSTPDYHALVLLNMVLGGQFVSRINMNLREHKGFTYGARTSFDFRRGPGPFQLQVSVQTAVTAAAIREALGEVQAVRTTRPITADELELARAALTRGYPRNFETGEQIARSLAQLALYGLPDTYFENFVPTINALTLHDVMRVAQAHVDDSRLTTLVVGDRTVVEAELLELGLGTAETLQPA